MALDLQIGVTQFWFTIHHVKYFEYLVQSCKPIFPFCHIDAFKWLRNQKYFTEACAIFYYFEIPESALMYCHRSVEPRASLFSNYIYQIRDSTKMPIEHRFLVTEYHEKFMRHLAREGYWEFPIQDKEVFKWCCKNGHYLDVQGLYQRTIHWVESILEGFRLSCINGHIDIVRWLCGKEILQNHLGSMIQESFKHGQNHIAEYLMSQCGHTFSPKIDIRFCCLDENLAYAKRMLSNFIDNCNLQSAWNIPDLREWMLENISAEYILELACTIGDIELAERFRNVDISTQRADKIFSNCCSKRDGFLPIIDIVRNQISYGVVEKEFNSACAKGNLEVAQLLIQHFEISKQIKAQGFEIACKNSKLKVAKWLYKTQRNSLKPGFSPSAFQDDRIVRWLARIGFITYAYRSPLAIYYLQYLKMKPIHTIFFVSYFIAKLKMSSIRPGGESYKRAEQNFLECKKLKEKYKKI